MALFPVVEQFSLVWDLPCLKMNFHHWQSTAAGSNPLHHCFQYVRTSYTLLAQKAVEKVEAPLLFVAKCFHYSRLDHRCFYLESPHSTRDIQSEKLRSTTSHLMCVHSIFQPRRIQFHVSSFQQYLGWTWADVGATGFHVLGFEIDSYWSENFKMPRHATSSAIAWHSSYDEGQSSVDF